MRAGIALAIVGLIGGVVGVFVVTRGLSFATDAFAHTVFPGAVLAAAAGTSLVIGGLIASLVAAVGVTAITRARGTSDDTAIAVVYTGLFAAGVILLSTLGPFDRDVMSFLFGSALGVSDGDVIAIAIVGAIAILTLFVIRRPLVAVTAGRGTARADGLPVTAVDTVLITVLAVTVVAVAQAIGNMLVVALLVTPAVTARLLAGRLRSTIVTAALAGLIAGIGGVYLSYHASLATGGSVVLVATTTVLIAMIASPRSGLVARVRRATASAGA